MEHVSIGDVQLAVEQRGDGEPLLLVHGFPLTHEMWKPQLDDLSAKFRLIAPDLRGFGASDVSPGTVTMDRFAEDLNALLDALGITEPITLCGLSMGGYIAWSFWSRYSSRVGRLILCDTRAAADSEEARANRRNVAERVLRDGPQFLLQVPDHILEAAERTTAADQGSDSGASETPATDTSTRAGEARITGQPAGQPAGALPRRQRALSQLMRKLFSPRTIDERPEVIAEVRKMILQNDPAGIAAASLGMAERPDATPLLPTINVPTLVLVGEDDGISTAEEMRQIAEQIPNAVFRVIPQAGHLAPLENAPAVNRAVREFLAD